MEQNVASKINSRVFLYMMSANFVQVRRLPAFTPGKSGWMNQKPLNGGKTFKRVSAHYWLINHQMVRGTAILWPRQTAFLDSILHNDQAPGRLMMPWIGFLAGSK